MTNKIEGTSLECWIVSCLSRRLYTRSLKIYLMERIVQWGVSKVGPSSHLNRTNPHIRICNSDALTTHADTYYLGTYLLWCWPPWGYSHFSAWGHSGDWLWRASSVIYHHPSTAVSPGESRPLTDILLLQADTSTWLPLFSVEGGCI